MAEVESKCPVCGHICKAEESMLVKGGATAAAMGVGAMFGGPVGAGLGLLAAKLVGLGASRAVLKYKCDECGHEFTFMQGGN